MNFVRLIPVFLSAALLSAHFSRASQHGLSLLCLLIPLLLFIRKKWVVYILQILLVFGALVWIETTLNYIQIRQEIGQPWLRLAIILGIVALFTAASALVFRMKGLRERYQPSAGTDIPGVISFYLTASLLAVVHIKIDNPMLLIERFIPTMGWIEIFLLALYARWVTANMLDHNKSARWRHAIWIVFSIVFFSQLILGLTVSETFLMTGNLHLPIPAMIIAGPLFRGDGFFMLILFLSTVLLVGPAWCSYLCYIGAWDNSAAKSNKQPQQLPKWRQNVRIAILLIIICSAIMLRIAGVSIMMATILALIFGLSGVAIMVFWSRKTGTMTHCVIYCPIGLLATWLGKINPFRIRITNGCTECQACTLSCRYDALSFTDIKNRKPASSCTLCGDCISSCKENCLEYRFLKLSPETARLTFIVIAVSIHVVFLGMARI